MRRERLLGYSVNRYSSPRNKNTKIMHDGRAISSHHPWVRVAGCGTNTHAHSRKRPAPLKRNSRSRHTFSPRDGKRGGYYFLSYAAPAVHSPSILRIFDQVTCPDASLTFLPIPKSAQRR
ncbi:hypothetical protein EVAR_36428_1 [Eumeta japonica]|uniref:Uncharacterized protein n=1 Tax=Eumeta variegata TaxID=151549 RepID=A0A4C1VQM6_EUMVA|nr:hypothetical protein EVAR_36428_1 [Eumeta japonica]